MKAPDKIYMPNELLSEEWCRHIEGQDTEYIRKDALLEWAKECFRLQDEGSWYSKGAAYAFSRVIDKLNEM